MSIIIRRQDGTRVRRLPNLNVPVLNYQHKPKKFLNIAVLKHLAPSRPRRTTIRQCFFDVSMVNNHAGLLNILKRNKIDPTTFAPGDFALFVNAKGTYAKIFGAHMGGGSHPIVAIKAPRGKLSPLLLSRLPEFFYGQAFDYDATLKPILEQYLAKKKRQRR